MHEKNEGALVTKPLVNQSIRHSIDSRTQVGESLWSMNWIHIAIENVVTDFQFWIQSSPFGSTVEVVFVTSLSRSSPSSSTSDWLPRFMELCTGCRKICPNLPCELILKPGRKTDLGTTPPISHSDYTLQAIDFIFLKNLWSPVCSYRMPNVNQRGCTDAHKGCEKEYWWWQRYLALGNTY